MLKSGILPRLWYVYGQGPAPRVMSTNPYESDVLLQQYLIFHYGSAEEQFPYAFGGADALDFPKRCVSEGIDVRCAGRSLACPRYRLFGGAVVRLNSRVIAVR